MYLCKFICFILFINLIIYIILYTYFTINY